MKNKDVPWIVFESKEWLDSYLKNNMKVFEWGSGGSTIYFSKIAKQVISVEHDPRWHKKVSNSIIKKGIKNCEYILVEPQKNILAKFFSYGENNYVSRSFKKYANFIFKDYVRRIDKFPDEYFDIVFVDGRSRAACIKHSISRIKKGGILILDNSERESYQPAIRLLDKFERLDFLGHGPYIKETWKTSIWKVN